MIRPWVSGFPAHKKALAAVVAVVGTVGVAATACANGGSGARTTSAAGAKPSSARSSGPGGQTGLIGSTSSTGSTISTGPTGSAGSSGYSATGAPNPSSPSGSASQGTTGGPSSSTSGGTPTSGVTTPTNPATPGSQAPATPRKNADVDCSVAKCIALTFDDGPGPDTGRLLDLLTAQNVPATFFVLGNQAVKYPGMVRREYTEGNEVGNHTWDHKDLSKLSAAAVQDEINHGADAIAAAGIPRPTLVRPPYGAVDDTVRSVAGFPFIMWRIDPEDWKYPDAARIADQIVGHAKPGRIVLSHDTHRTTVDAMPAVIQRLKQEGYTFVTVSTLMKGVPLQNGKSYFNRPVEDSQH